MFVFVLFCFCFVLFLFVCLVFCWCFCLFFKGFLKVKFQCIVCLFLFFVHAIIYIPLYRSERDVAFVHGARGSRIDSSWWTH